jgi:hypothetical protein
MPAAWIPSPRWAQTPCPWPRLLTLNPSGVHRLRPKAALRSVKEDEVKVEQFHPNPVRAGQLKRAKDRGQSSVGDYTGGLRTTGCTNGILPIDRVLLSAGERVRNTPRRKVQ